MKGALIAQYLDKLYTWQASCQDRAMLKRAEQYILQRPVLDYSEDALWTGEAKYEAVALIQECRRAI